MSVVHPEHVVFTNNLDLIDYVGRGLPPSKKDYARFIEAVKYPLLDEDVPNPAKEDIIITRRIFFDVDQDQMAAILNEVYKNNCHNRNIGIGAFVAGIGLGLLLSPKIR